MAEQENVQAVQRLYAAFQGGDSTAFLNTLADNVEWFVPGPKQILPWAGRRQGREQVAQFFTEFAQTAETEQFEPREFIAQGERVVVPGHRRDRVKATGRIFESDWVQVFSVSEGKIARFRGYIDTAAMVAAFRGD
jgi:ketosteroid isomerase-like protein